MPRLPPYKRTQCYASLLRDTNERVRNSRVIREWIASVFPYEPANKGGRATTTVRDQDQSREKRLEEAGFTSENTWEGDCKKPPPGTGSLPGEEGQSMGVVTGKCKWTLSCPLGNTELSISLSLPSTQREVNISSCSLQEKAGQGRSSIFSSAWKWLTVYMNRVAQPAVCAGACLSSTTKLNNCCYNCFKAQLLERPWHDNSVFFSLSFSAVSISSRIKLSEVAQLQPCTTKIHGRGMYKKSVY